MSDVLSFAELDGQHVELLPARTVLSLFGTVGNGGNGGTGGAGGSGTGGFGVNLLNINAGGDQFNNGGNGIGGNGGNANGGNGQFRIRLF
jgi:hypothetical protein